MRPRDKREKALHADGAERVSKHLSWALVVLDGSNKFKRVPSSHNHRDLPEVSLLVSFWCCSASIHRKEFGGHKLVSALPLSSVPCAYFFTEDLNV